MENFFKGFIIFSIITILILVIPLRLFCSLEDLQYDDIKVQGDIGTYSEKFTKIMNLDNMDSESKGLVMQMMKISNDYVLKTRMYSYILVGYLVLILSVTILICGTLFIKKFTDKKYISRALILSSLFSILTLMVLSINVYFIYFKH